MIDEAKTWSARKPLFWGFLTIALLIGGVGAWSVFTTLSGAVIAPGQVEVSQSRQIVQHPDGGVVETILVSEGAIVDVGDVLLRLDGSPLRSELAIVENQLYELASRRARLEAERDVGKAVSFPKSLSLAAETRADVAEMIKGQASLFAAHAEALAQDTNQRQKRIEQIEAQVKGIEAQRTAFATQIALHETELATQKDLLAKGLTQATRVSSIKREIAEAKGRAGELTAALAEAGGRVTEIEIEITSLVTERRETAEAELREVVARELELRERQRALSERIARLDIRAPASGIVLGLLVTTPQAVIRPADALMYIVPQDRPLLVAARVPVTHVDEVTIGQDVRLVFSSLPSRTTPERSGATYYRAEIAITLDDLKSLGAVDVVPGMPVDAFIRTADRTPLSYLLKPFTDYFQKALRET
jgi:HlyD family secretion protein